MNETPIQRLAALPQRPEEIWQGGLVRVRAWVTGEGPTPYRPYLPLWIAVSTGRVHAGRLLRPQERNFGAVVDALVEFACDRQIGGYRPGRVEVADAALAEHLSGLLAEAEMEVRLVDRLETLERVMDDLERFGQPGRQPVPGPLEGRGVTIPRMQRFAEAAAAFYRAAPWQYLTDIDLVRIDSPECPPGMEIAVVLGAGRWVYGLAFYRSVADYTAFHKASVEGERDTRRLAGNWQLSFNAVRHVPPKDSDLWEDHGLALADAQAYPVVLRFDPHGEVSRPTARHLAFLEGLLWAFADTREDEIDSGRWEKEVVTFDGQVRAALAIPDLLKPPTYQEWLKRGFTPDCRIHERMFADMHRCFRAHPASSAEEMNAVLQSQFMGKKIDELVTQPETPLERAQELCFDAFDTFGRRRVQLARQALALSPDCADAHVLLAEQAVSLEAKLTHYTEGVAAGERALGPEAFQENAGHFWGVSGTRPYMRARFGLASTLEALGRPEEAVEHYQELLRLNPKDNQGVRHPLMPLLMNLRRDGDAARLLKQYQEPSANWAYARALLAFRLSGNSAAAGRELREALRANPAVPPFLLSDEQPPTPPHYSPGSVEEAIVCAEELGPAFRATEGALEWLAAEHRRREKELQARRKEQKKKQREQRKKRKDR